MNINKVKMCFKIMDAVLENNSEILSFKYLDNLVDENGNKLDQKILKENLTRVYIVTVNDEIYKIGQSEDKGGIIGTLRIYKDGGIKGRPSIRSYGMYIFIKNELEKGNKVSFYMIYQDKIETNLKGLFGFHNEIKVNISSKYLEEYCLLDYKTANNDNLPKWNLQEQGIDWPDIIKIQHSKILEDSTKRKGRNK